MRRERSAGGVFTRRALMMMGAQTGLLGLLSARLYKLQVVEGRRYATMADENRISARIVAPPRGRILDRAGTVLAGNRLNWRALLNVEEASNVGTTLDAFSRLVPLPDHERARIEREVHHHRRFIPILLAEALSWEDMARIEANAPDLPGVIVDMGATRLYPFGANLAHVVGYVAPPREEEARDDPMLALPGIRTGRAGMERGQDLPLRGQPSVVQLEVNAIGRVIRELDRQEGAPGEDVTLTIDNELQNAVLARLGEESASAVVMDCRNGEVLAMASNPSFDPSLFNSGISEAQWTEWTKDPRAPLVNKALDGVYPPGSTFKMAVALAGLAAKTVAPTDRVNCVGYLDIGDTRFHCWRKGGHGSVDMRSGIKHSCDVYFYHVALRTGIDRIAAMANRLGMGVDLPTDMPGARPGLIPTREWREGQGKAWNLGDTVVSGIGQGYLQVTPLQLATYVARIASGRLIVPHFTRKIGAVLQPEAQPENWSLLDLSDKELAIVRYGMWAVVNDGGGTAPAAQIPAGLGQLAGKTGSVQVRRVSRAAREHGFKSERLAWALRPHALFVAYAPYENPRYALSVVVEHGNAGAAAAAPVARDIMIDVLTRDPVNRPNAPTRVAETRRS